MFFNRWSTKSLGVYNYFQGSRFLETWGLLNLLYFYGKIYTAKSKKKKLNESLNEGISETYLSVRHADMMV